MYSATYFPELLHITAIHEAGHAWAYAKWNLPLRYVTVRPRNPNIAGQCMLWGPRRISVEKAGEIAAAGPIAETRHALLTEGEDERAEFEDYLNATFTMGGEHDLPKAKDFLNTRAYNKEGFIIHDPAKVLYEEITDDWNRIMRAADRLVRDGTVSGKEIFAEFRKGR